MTLFMIAAQKVLPPAEKSPLPPATLVDEALGLSHSDRTVSDVGKAEVAMISHFVFSMVSGALYAMIRKQISYDSSRARIGMGALFGLVVWAVSYAGWMPLLKFRASACSMPRRRNFLMLGAHVVWGVALGYAENELSERGLQLLDGARKATNAE
jgi:uncharacterized membrane protein YagU involved in acid resistance